MIANIFTRTNRLVPWLLLLGAGVCDAAGAMPRIEITADMKGFQFTGSGARFVPWGFNYDHDRSGRLIEDYWHDEWNSVAEDFREMKALGANVVRVHLQFARFMRSPTEPDERNLAQLRRLLALAEETGLYLDLTGLGCYHKKDVPAWYDAMNEAERWDAQAKFWEVIAQTCAGSSAIFFYDLMNEPVSPAGRSAKTGDWLGPAFGGKHFVQRISLDQAGRERWQVAKAWIDRLCAAIRKHDAKHLVSVGMVDWSLDRPGLTSGFVPAKVGDALDFQCVHLYPKEGKLQEAVETLRCFAAAGRPVVIEETFPLGCSMEEFARFIETSKGVAAGWIGFYWGRKLEEYPAPNPLPRDLSPEKLAEEIRKNPEAFGDMLMRGWLEFFKAHAPKT